MTERRVSSRVEVKLFLSQYEKDRQLRVLAANLSPTGIFVHRVNGPDLCADRVVGLELLLPDEKETIWARGEIKRVESDEMASGLGIEFTGIPELYAARISEFIGE